MGGFSNARKQGLFCGRGRFPDQNFQNADSLFSFVFWAVSGCIKRPFFSPCQTRVEMIRRSYFEFQVRLFRKRQSFIILLFWCQILCLWYQKGDSEKGKTRQEIPQTRRSVDVPAAWPALFATFEVPGKIGSED